MDYRITFFVNIEKRSYVVFDEILLKLLIKNLIRQLIFDVQLVYKFLQLLFIQFYFFWLLLFLICWWSARLYCQFTPILIFFFLMSYLKLPFV